MIKRKLRIPMRDLTTLTGEEAEIASKNRLNGRDLNIFRVLMNHPQLARRWTVFAGHVLVGAGHDLADGNAGLDVLQQCYFASDELFGLGENCFDILVGEKNDAAAIRDNPVAGIDDNRPDGNGTIEVGFDDAAARGSRDDAAGEDRESEFTTLIDIAAHSVNNDAGYSFHHGRS